MVRILEIVFVFLVVQILQADYTNAMLGSTAPGANTGQYPYIAALEINNTIDKDCAAVIIRSDAVLTAGHCVKHEAIENITIRAGTFYTRQQEAPNLPIQVRKVSNFVVHENFNASGNGEYDIAIVFVSQNFKMSTFVNTIALAKEEDHGTFVNQTGIIMGYGYTETLNRSDVLLTTTLKAGAKNDCELFEGFEEAWLQASLCVLAPNKMEGPCRGDSAGPLVITKNNIPTVVGISSWGAVSFTDVMACLIEPGFSFTDIAVVRAWIDKWLGTKS